MQLLKGGKYAGNSHLTIGTVLDLSTIKLPTGVSVGSGGGLAMSSEDAGEKKKKI